MKALIHVLLMGVVGIAWAPLVNALTRDITAIYRADSSNPRQDKFTNTTPVSGYCADGAAQWCKDNNVSSFILPISFQSGLAIRPGHGVREGVMFKVPANWRNLDVVDRGTGHRETVEVRISGIGTRYLTNLPLWELVGLPPGQGFYYASVAMWGAPGFWSDGVPPPCKATYYGAIRDDGTGEDFFWLVPTDGVCAKKANYLIPEFSYDSLQFSYELRTPNPLTMRAGQYAGTINYTIGPSGDFDLGDVMLPSDSSLTLNFTLDVEHVLKVDIPPGGDRVELVPEGGWQAWLQNPARVPKKLFRDQTFNISASGPFSMRLICSHVYGDHCGIQNAAPHAVPVIVRVSLPNGLTDGAGFPVVRQNLYRTLTRQFKPAMYVDGKPATLHFDVEHYLNEVFRDHVGSTYSGTITVVWDSDV